MNGLVFRGAACACVCLSLMTAPAWAQTTGATLQGTITDDQGGALPAATVTITNVETGISRTVVTDIRGWYRAAALPPGVYALKVEIQGFVTYQRSGMHLTIGQEATVNATLQIATLQETVSVTAAVPLVEATNSALGTTISRTQLDTLPLAGRNFTSLAQTAPGITGVGGGGVNAGGQLSRNNSFIVDGTSNDDNVVTGTRGGISLEAVREYVVLANQFAAEFGQASGAVINIITRSGTNQLQGRGFMLHRDDSFDAQDPFSKGQGSGQAPFSQQRYGGFLGGPVVRDKVHYFASYEGLRQDETSVVTSLLVPVAEREVPHPIRGHQFFIKTDQQLTGRQSLAVRYRLDKQDELGAGIGGLNTIERGRDTLERNHDVVANHTSILSDRALNEFRFQRGYRNSDNIVDRFSPIGTPAIIRPSGNFGKANNMPQGRKETRYQFVNNFSYSVGSHDFKTGTDISLIRVNSYFYRNIDGEFTFRTDAPFNAADLATYPILFTQNIGDPNLHRVNDLYAFFAQDTWRVRPNFTLNVGVRYDFETAFAEAAGVPKDMDNIAPRLGFVWDPFKSGRTAIRGGYGIYYDQAFLNVTGNVMLSRNFRGVTIQNPGYPDAFSRGNAAAPSAPSTTVAASDVQTSVTRQITLGVKRELVSGLAVSVDGVSSRGRHLFAAPDENAPDPVTRLRPNPNFQTITTYTTDGNSWYNGLLVGLERRSGKGPHFGVSYTLSKQLRDVEDFTFVPQNNYDRAAEKARANNDRRHQFVANSSWSLPAGFQIAGILQARSGLPWNVTTGTDNNGDANVNDRPDLISPDADPFDRTSYFGGFTGRVGTLGRNANNGFDYFSIDVRISKFVRIGTRKFEAFAEAFNVTNRVNFRLPNGNIRSASFGLPSQLAEGATPRQVELGFRFDF